MEPIQRRDQERQAGRDLPVLREISDSHSVGEHLGCVKWWNDRLGYGFITVCRGADKGKDIFVHHTGIRPASSHYRTLYKGEYVMFDTQVASSRSARGEEPHAGLVNNAQATNVTGVDGGCLMCDHVQSRSGSRTFARTDELDRGAWGGVSGARQ